MLVEEKIAAVAKEIDSDFDGILTFDEFKLAADSFGFTKDKSGAILSYDDEQKQVAKIQEVYNMFDSNGDGKVDVAEFCRFVLPDEDLLTKAFIQFDTDKSGSLSRKELKSALKALPRPDDPALKAGGKALDKMLASFDQDGDDSIDLQEWIANMSPSLRKLLVACMDENYSIQAFAKKHPPKSAAPSRDATEIDTKLEKKSGLRSLKPVGGGLGARLSAPSGADLKAKFEQLDSSKDGLLEKGELKSAMAALLPGVDSSILTAVLNTEFSKADGDMSGALSFAEFEKFYQAVVPQLGVRA
jgi:Ca2+-binding EF-hand superfamily protein